MRYALVALAIVALLVVISRRDVSQAGGYFTVTVRTVNLKPAAATDNGAAVSEAGTLVDVSHTKQGSLSDVVTISETSTSSDVRRANASDTVAISESSTRSDTRRPTRTDTGATVSESRTLTRIPSPTPSSSASAGTFAGVVLNQGSDIAAWKAWLSPCTQHIAHDYTNGGSSPVATWAEINTFAGTQAGYPAGTSLIWSIGPFPAQSSLAAIATGAGDSFFTTWAQAILASDNPLPDGNLYIRPMWEMPQSNYPWVVQGVANPANYRAAFQHFAAAFHAVSPKFKIVWDIFAGPDPNGGGDDSAYYPGDAYVDVIAEDTYPDTSASSASAAWSATLTDPNGLNWIASMATTHNKPTATFEWGVNSNSGSAIITDYIAWWAAHRTVVQTYFDINWDGTNGQNQLDSGQWPTAGAQYKASICSGA